MEIADLIVCGCVFTFTAIGLVCDLRVRKLPNVLTVPAFGVGLLFHIVYGLWQTTLWTQLSFSLGGFALGFGVILILWFIGGSGGGDVKFMGALGTWLGAWHTFQVLVLSAILAGLITVIVLGSKVFQLKPMRGKKSNARSQQAGKNKQLSREDWLVPYGVPAALATWTLLAWELTRHGSLLPVGA